MTYPGSLPLPPVEAGSERPLVTVVMPARNEASVIGSALDAVAAQTYPSDLIEVVVVDGGSIDATAQEATRHLEHGSFRRWSVVPNVDGGTPSNLNVGLRWAEGAVLVRIDARSIVPMDYVESLVAALRDETRSVVGGAQVAVARSSRWRDRAIARALNNRVGMGGSRYRRAGAASGPADTVYLGVFRTEQLRQIGGWNEAFATNQDFELNRAMSGIGTVWFEANLPVAYLPRQTYRELAAQYHRFGRWKMAYWRSTSDRPRPRQLVLVALPPIVFAGIGLGAGTLGVARTGWIAVAGIGSVLAVDAIGGHTTPASAPVRVTAGGVNVVIGASWWAGIVREWVRSEISLPESTSRSAGAR